MYWIGSLLRPHYDNLPFSLCPDYVRFHLKYGKRLSQDAQEFLVGSRMPGGSLERRGVGNTLSELNFSFKQDERQRYTKDDKR
jgi:hypothetical protein